MSTVREIFCRGSPYGAGLALVCLCCLMSLPLEFVISGGGWVVLCCVGSWQLDVLVGTSWKVLHCNPSSATACILPRITWYELLSEMHMVGDSAGFGGAWKQPVQHLQNRPTIFDVASFVYR